MPDFDGAVLHGVENLQTRHNFATRERLNLKLVVSGFGDGLCQQLGGRRKGCRGTSASSPACAI